MPESLMDAYRMPDGYWTGVLQNSDRWGGTEQYELQLFRKAGNTLVRFVKSGKGTIYYILYRNRGEEIYIQDVRLSSRFQRNAENLLDEIPGTTFFFFEFSGSAPDQFLLPVSEKKTEGGGREVRSRPLTTGKVTSLEVLDQVEKKASNIFSLRRVDFYRENRILFRRELFEYREILFLIKSASLPAGFATVRECMDLDTGRSSRIEWQSYDARIQPSDLFFDPRYLGRN